MGLAMLPVHAEQNKQDEVILTTLAKGHTNGKRSKSKTSSTRAKGVMNPEAHVEGESRPAGRLAENDSILKTKKLPVFLKIRGNSYF